MNHEWCPNCEQDAEGVCGECGWMPPQYEAEDAADRKLHMLHEDGWTWKQIQNRDWAR